MVSDRAFKFHIYIPWGKTLSLVPKSRSSVKVKVKYQGHSFKKNGSCGGEGISVSQTQLVSYGNELIRSAVNSYVFFVSSISVFQFKMVVSCSSKLGLYFV